MKAKTFLILWMLGFLFVAPKWISSMEAKAKDRVTGAVAASAADAKTTTTLGFVSFR